MSPQVPRLSNTNNISVYLIKNTLVVSCEDCVIGKCMIILCKVLEQCSTCSKFLRKGHRNHVYIGSVHLAATGYFSVEGFLLFCCVLQAVITAYDEGKKHIFPVQSL